MVNKHTPAQTENHQNPALPAYLVAEKTIVNKDAVQAISQHLVHQSCSYSAVYSTGQGADHMVLRSHLQALYSPSYHGNAANQAALRVPRSSC